MTTTKKTKRKKASKQSRFTLSLPKALASQLDVAIKSFDPLIEMTHKRLILIALEHYLHQVFDRKFG